MVMINDNIMQECNIIMNSQLYILIHESQWVRLSWLKYYSKFQQFVGNNSIEPIELSSLNIFK